ncbi:MAG: thioredoxin family protein [Gammaproteobacteria bacterium]|nr:thioredoxin family protein [Gammaproteobacteria bacterium]
MTQPPKVLFFLATGCQHCPSVLQSLGELIKAGSIAELEVVNLQQSPERAVELNVRSVPWVKIGPFELVGMRTKTELKQWIERVNEPQAMADYYAELMTTGEIAKVIELVHKSPQSFAALVTLMADSETTLSVRIGVGAIIEEFAGSELLKQNIELLAQYTQDKDARIRNDACFYLGLSRDKAAEAHIRPLLESEDAETREIAEEALEEILNS